MQFIRLLVLTFSLAAAAACAGGGPADGETSPSDPEDVGSDVSVAQDASDATDTRADVADVQDDPCGVCCPGERTCSSESAVGVCADDGSGFDEEACGEGQICEDGSCVDEPVCEPNETVCNDATSRLICRATGTGWRTETCADGSACVDGECVTGAPIGTECSANSDCAGGKCRCGSDEPCGSAPSRPYCTSTCTPGSCGPGQICVSSADFNGANYDHCLPTCDQSCPHQGMTCASLPTRDSGELAYVQACYFEGVTDVGEECSSDAECTGGTCLQDYFANTTLCTFECDGGCPQGTACVELEAGTFHCSPLCGNGSVGGTDNCPLEGGGDRWDVTCAVKTTSENTAKRVCVRNSSP